MKLLCEVPLQTLTVAVAINLTLATGRSPRCGSHSWCSARWNFCQCRETCTVDARWCLLCNRKSCSRPYERCTSANILHLFNRPVIRSPCDELFQPHTNNSKSRKHIFELRWAECGRHFSTQFSPLASIQLEKSAGQCIVFDVVVNAQVVGVLKVAVQDTRYEVDVVDEESRSEKQTNSD